MTARDLIVAPPFAREVEEGLTKSPKSLPSKLFYDALGSELFENITRLPEYYLTRTELEILQQHAAEMAGVASLGVKVVELGAGTATKTCALLQAVARRQGRVTYFPVDLSPAALGEARKRVESQCPRVCFSPVITDFSEGFGFLRNITGPKLVLYLGSSIGNFNPEVAAGMLRGLRKELETGDALLLGTDLVKDPAILVPAYDDAQGVTAEFNKNILRRINRELEANFDVDSFLHVALWNQAHSRMEMHLESVRPQMVHIGMLRLGIEIQAGERIHTENSCKYTTPMVCDLLAAAGFRLEETWLDRCGWFAVHLARV
jgi:dimethylhistidine N-methyltransferase